MESRSHALMAGFFTIALITLATVFALWLGKDRIQRTPYLIATKLSVAGLNLQAAVRYKGIKVGNVTDIDFDDKLPGQILLRLDVLPDTPVTPSTYATLGYQGVTGIAYVQLDEDARGLPVTVQKANGMLLIPLRPGMMQNLEQRGMAILEQTEELGKRMNSLLDPGNSKSLTSAIDSMNRAAVAWQSVPAKLDPVLSSLPALVDNTRDSVNAFKVLTENASNTSGNFNRLALQLQANDGLIARLNQTVDQIGMNLTQETLPAVNSLSREARSSMRTINKAAETLSEHPQSLLFGSAPAAPGPGEAGFIAPR